MSLWCGRWSRGIQGFYRKEKVGKGVCCGSLYVVDFKFVPCQESTLVLVQFKPAL